MADKRNYRVHVPETIDCSENSRLGRSQEAFAETCGFTLAAVRDWEQAPPRVLSASARILLKMVEKGPEAVDLPGARALGAFVLLGVTDAAAKASEQRRGSRTRSEVGFFIATSGAHTGRNRTDSNMAIVCGVG